MSSLARHLLIRPRASPRDPRGLTLVEVLASLTLLSAVAAASLSVIQSAGRASVEHARRIAQHREAAALLDSIAADLMNADIDPIGDRARGESRVKVEADSPACTIAIRTRDPVGGPCTRRYTFARNRTFVASIPTYTPAHSSPPPAHQPPALTHVQALHARIDPDLGALLVVLDLEHTGRHTRVFPFASEPTP